MFDIEDTIKLSFYGLGYGQQVCGEYGKIENWTQLTDLGGVQVTKVPLRYVYKYLIMFQSNLK